MSNTPDQPEQEEEIEFAFLGSAEETRKALAEDEIVEAEIMFMGERNPQPDADDSDSRPE